MGTKGQVAPKKLYAMRSVLYCRPQEMRSCGKCYFLASSRLRQSVFVSGPYGASGLVGANDEHNAPLHSLNDGQQFLKQLRVASELRSDCKCRTSSQSVSGWPKICQRIQMKLIQ